MTVITQGSHNILTLAIRDRAALYAAFMPFIKNGGLFVVTTQEYQLGEEVFLLLSLLDEHDRLPVTGKVVWITPRGAQGSRVQGIGVQFSDSDNGTTRSKIENLLLGMKSAGRPTHTM
jgi:type IV pilus assembly protein PilZ